jgi:hypothetical protein
MHPVTVSTIQGFRICAQNQKIRRNEEVILFWLVYHIAFDHFEQMDGDQHTRS